MAQTEMALERIKKRLAEAGTGRDNVVKFGRYLTDRSYIKIFYAARDG